MQETQNPSTTDDVNSPSHYKKGDVECIDGIESSMTRDAFRGYLKGNILKYVWRYEDKGQQVKDLRKARWYLERLIKSHLGKIDS